MPGFTRHIREGVQLASNQTARIDVVLDVATETTQVTVTAEGAARIETESAKLADVRSL
jgi:hypothetical protein